MSECKKVDKRRKKLVISGKEGTKQGTHSMRSATMTIVPYSGHDFFDVFADVFTYPDDLVMHEVEYGYDARLEDARRIRRDMDKAAETLGVLQQTT